MAHCNLGSALCDTGRQKEGIAELRQAIALDPNLAIPHFNLGIELRAKGELDKAIAEYREALRLKKDYAEAHYNLGNALKAKGRLDEAISEYREAIKFKKDKAEAYVNLGGALQGEGKLDEAITLLRRAVTLQPDLAEAHCTLGLALRDKGEFRQALASLRRGHELGTARGLRWRNPSAEWLRECERLAELDGRLPDLLAGKITPASPEAGIEWADVCALKRLHRTAARFYAAAFAARPGLMDDPNSDLLDCAACAAARAGCGEGEDVAKLDNKEKERLRGQALGWLQRVLAVRTRQPAGREPPRRPRPPSAGPDAHYPGRTPVA